MEDKERKDEKELQKGVKEETEKVIKSILNEGINSNNISYLYKAIDIHKDMANEEYWKSKEEESKMRYRNYGRENYGTDMIRNYSEGGYGRDSYDDSYGRRRRDSRGRYMDHGEAMLDEAKKVYQAYSDNRGRYEYGVYGAKEDAVKNLKEMLECTVDLFEFLKENASSKEEMDLIKKYTREISEM